MFPSEPPFLRIQFYLTAPYPCSYLEDREARSQVAAPAHLIGQAAYSRLIREGFRRSGHYTYRPHCYGCKLCVPVRIEIDRFESNRSQKRNFRQNQSLTARILPLEFREEHYALYRRYQRARQMRREDGKRQQVLPVLIHGDAAFAGQGVVMELFQMSQARGFAVGGTVHIVINNQVGFTISRQDDARSTFYCTDPAKIIGAPVLHVNGDDPEAVAFCAQLAFDFRKEFRRDVVIDLVCYRRHGHNEADEPAATQPLMYQNIRARKTTRELYAERLAAEGVLDAAGARALMDTYRDKLDKGEVTTELAKVGPDPYAVDWSPWLKGKLSDAVQTGLARPALDSLASRINTLPDTLTLHPRVAKIYEDRRRMAAGELAMDWGFAENLAYATLLAEGYKLRLVGQDAGRGTFFHRHAVLHDQATGEARLPLRALAANPEHVMVIDSLLSEEAVMAFEYGYSTAEPGTLNIWEGQFGDFANGAQIMIDEQSFVLTRAFAEQNGLWPRKPVGGGLSPSDTAPTPAGVPPLGGGTTQPYSPHTPIGQPPAVEEPRRLQAEGPLKEALGILFDRARGSGCRQLAALTVQCFDAGDLFRLLPAANGVSGANKCVTVNVELEMAEGGLLKIEFTGPLAEAQLVREFLQPQLIAAKDKNPRELRVELRFNDGLDLAGDAPERLRNQLTQVGNAAVFVSAEAERA